MLQLIKFQCPENISSLLKLSNLDVVTVIWPEVTKKSLNSDILKDKLVTSAVFVVMKIIYILSSIHHMGFVERSQL